MRRRSPVSSNDTVLEAVPNVSEGRDEACIAAFGRALGAHGCSLLDVHSDADHNRSVFTLVGGPQELADSLLAAARTRDRARRHARARGRPPVHRRARRRPDRISAQDDRELAQDEALAVANRLAGELEPARVRVRGAGELRPPARACVLPRGRRGALAERMASGELAPDFGPARLHPTAGAALVGARPPLVAFNVELDTDDVDVAKADRGQGPGGETAGCPACARSA